MEQMEDLIFKAGASDNDVMQLTNSGYLLYYEQEACFFLDVFFPLHNTNFKPSWKKSPFKAIIDANFCIDEFSKKYIYQEELNIKKLDNNNHKLSTSTNDFLNISYSIESNRIEPNRIELNRTESQNLQKNTNYNKQDINTETGTESEPEKFIISKEVVTKLLEDGFDNNEIVSAIQIIQNRKIKDRIKNPYSYIKTSIIRNRANANSGKTDYTSKFINLDMLKKIEIAKKILISNPLIEKKYKNKIDEFVNDATLPQFFGLFKKEMIKEEENEQSS